MEDNKRFESVYSTKVRAGKRRTYFFDVKQTKGGDYYITLTESTKKFTGEGYERHKIFLYKEDFNRFVSSLQETVDHVKTELMPDYDYEIFEKRQEEWEAQQAEMEANGTNNSEGGDATADTNKTESTEDTASTEEDISW